MVAQFPGSHNTFVPDHAASNKLVVDFSRNPNRFAVNKYTQIVPVKKTVGYYLEMTVEERGRILNTDLSDFAWPDGKDAPEDFDGTEAFEFKAFRTERYKYGFRLGDLTIDQSSWDITAQHAGIKAQQAMTARTQLAVTALTTSGNYASSHRSAVASISGNTGTWAASTTARQDIKRSLNHAANQILLDTLAAVDVNDLIVVVNPTLARAMSECQEIVDHIKGSPDALAQVRGELPGRNAMFGLPDQLYGFPICVEATAKVTTRKGASSTTKAYVLGDSTAFMTARPGGLEGLYGAPSFSTCSIFMLEEMTVETKHDDDNRVTKGRVVENYDVVMTAPVSGFLFTSAQ